MFKKLFKRKEIVDPIFREGRLAFSNGVAVSDNPYKSTSTERAQVWESGWHEAQASRQEFEVKQKYGENSSNSSSGVFGIFAVVIGVVTFFGCWIYAIATYGLFLGLAFGWIPALIIAIIITLLSPVIAILLLIAVIILLIVLTKRV
ncbi:MAG: hypothetical protein KG012_21735 [Deltaproteobacteria bacterium]|nr:hypothetical protein [Deltaproteobacteria bacterium]